MTFAIVDLFKYFSSISASFHFFVVSHLLLWPLVLSWLHCSMNVPQVSLLLLPYICLMFTTQQKCLLFSKNYITAVSRLWLLWDPVFLAARNILLVFVFFFSEKQFQCNWGWLIEQMWRILNFHTWFSLLFWLSIVYDI